MKHFTLFLSLLLLMPLAGLAQANDPANTILLSGIVTDQEGEPLPYAPILIKGTSSGFYTDEDGYFLEEVPPAAELIVSYVGHEDKRIKLDANVDQTLEIQLAAGIELSTVVVIGYSTIRCQHSRGCGTTCYPYNPPASTSSAVEMGKPEMTPSFGLPTASVFPNPFQDHFNLRLRMDGTASVSAELFDITGRKLDAWNARTLSPGDNTLTFYPDSRQLPPGTYLLRLTDAEGQIETRKLIRAQPLR